MTTETLHAHARGQAVGYHAATMRSKTWRVSLRGLAAEPPLTKLGYA
jgi:hypothetical protein